MNSNRVSRVLVILLFAAALGAPSWAEPSRQAERSVPFELLARAWSSLAAVWQDIGCGIDPHGGCTPDATPPPSTDIGCSLDPHGGCTPES